MKFVAYATASYSQFLKVTYSFVLLFFRNMLHPLKSLPLYVKWNVYVSRALSGLVPSAWIARINWRNCNNKDR